MVRKGYILENEYAMVIFIKYKPLVIRPDESNTLATPKSASFTGAEFSLFASKIL